MPAFHLNVANATSQLVLPLGAEPITIGRHPGNVLVLPDDRASRYHCVIELREGQVLVTDLGSRNGTLVNGQRLSGAAPLRAGDVVRVGGVRIELAQQDAPTDAAPSTALDQTTVAPAEEPPPPAAPTSAVTPPPRAPASAATALPTTSTSATEPDNLPPIDLSDIPWEGTPAPGVRRGAQLAGAGGPAPGAGSSMPRELSPREIASLVAQQEKQLRQVLDELPDRTLTQADLTLINARGQRMATPPPTAGKVVEGREGLVIFHLLLLLCARTGASDLHVEPKRDDFLVRIRVDGMMVEIMRLHRSVSARLVNVVKVVSDLDIAQKQVIQEGHFSTDLAGRRVDYRVSFAPAMFGQNLVVRVLDMSRLPCYVKELGMPRWMSQNVYQTVQQDAGMLIVCGPTGSGKTTSLYAVIRDIDVARRNVITIEDPPEFNIDGVTQIGINEQQGNTFSSLLRSVLRQDPDVILVGEIRDAETARIAMQASMTGHLVLTTVHARDGLGTIFRLLDLGVEPFLIASALNLVLAQRLVRRLCEHCRVPARPKLEHLSRMGRYGEGVSQVYYPGGCPRCLNTGYSGRQGIFELVTATEDLRDVILKSPTMQELRKAVAMTVFASLRDSGHQLVAQGATSLDEIDRVLGIE